MGTFLSFRTDSRERVADAPRREAQCTIVIFPGVRIERQGVDLGPDSSRPSSGSGKLDGTNGRRRRKTS
jgi:hypothetical protein